MTATKDRRAAIDSILNAPDLPSHIRSQRKSRGRRTEVPPAWRVAMEVGEDDLYPPPPNGQVTPFDGSDPNFLATNPALPVDATYLPDVTPYSTDEPWGMMEGETARDYQLFSYFRALGLSRTKGEVAKHFEISSNYVYRCSSENDWDSRVRAWDVYREKIYTLGIVEETRGMAEIHGRVAAEGILALASAFQELVSRMNGDPELWKDELAEIPTKQLIGIAQRSAQVIPNLMNAERLSRGLPTEISAQLNLSRSESTITLQSTDDLAEILSGLFGVIGNRGSAESERSEEVIDAVVVDDGDGESAA